MTTRIRIPRFKSEKAEADWWDAHPEVITELFPPDRVRRRVVLNLHDEYSLEKSVAQRPDVVLSTLAAQPRHGSRRGGERASSR
jgi:hypothetical protein